MSCRLGFPLLTLHILFFWLITYSLSYSKLVTISFFIIQLIQGYVLVYPTTDNMQSLAVTCHWVHVFSVYMA
jgi:hypothetical protein